jgi:DNA-binding NarL/FixJ family response regulator
MSQQPTLVFATADVGLVAHWHGAFVDLQQLTLTTASTVWLDLALPGVPKFEHGQWVALLKDQCARVIATSSNPSDSEAIQALDTGCIGYCHAFSDPSTLRQVQKVVDAGQVWIGVTLMRRLVQSAAHAASARLKDDKGWADALTAREREVAILAANGFTNMEIARNCGISERTVKAHLSSVFDKLSLTDRLQLALRVHGIS